MESANLHLQDHLAAASSSLPTASSSYGVEDAHSWNPNMILSSSNFPPNVGEAISNLSEPRQNTDTVVPSLDNFMIQNLKFNHWTSTSSSSSHDQSIGKIKEELSDLNPKFTNDLNDLSEKLMLKTLTSSYRTNAHPFSPGEVYSYPQNFSNFGNGVLPSRGNFSHCQIYPSINVSNLTQYSSLPTSFSTSIHPEPLDLQASARFVGSFSQRSSDSLRMVEVKESEAFGQGYSQKPCSPIRVSNMSRGSVAEAKRVSNSMERKVSQAAPKKPRLDQTRTSCPPFKVRKEKLGDRIAALQQLVAPFGKTDTASVLMEAIGYIKFLTNQVETLCVPYVNKASRCKTSRQMNEVSVEGDGSDEPKRDLRSRGLCLVPLSCMTYITSEGGPGGGIWPPSNFPRGT